MPDPYLPNQQETVAPVPAGPLTTFSDGIYEIGAGDGQIPPGKYRAAPAPSGFGYIHLKKANGDYGDSASGKGQATRSRSRIPTRRPRSTARPSRRHDLPRAFPPDARTRNSRTCSATSSAAGSGYVLTGRPRPAARPAVPRGRSRRPRRPRRRGGRSAARPRPRRGVHFPQGPDLQRQDGDDAHGARGRGAPAGLAIHTRCRDLRAGGWPAVAQPERDRLPTRARTGGTRPRRGHRSLPSRRWRSRPVTRSRASHRWSGVASASNDRASNARRVATSVARDDDDRVGRVWHRVASTGRSRARAERQTSVRGPLDVLDLQPSHKRRVKL